MLDKEVFLNKFNQLLMAFPNWKVEYDNPNTMRFWHSMFDYMENDRFEHMVDSYIADGRFNPTIGGLKEYDTAYRKSAAQLRHEAELKKQREGIGDD